MGVGRDRTTYSAEYLLLPLVWGNQGTANLVAGWVPPYEALVQVRSARKGCAISTAQVSPGKLPDIPRLGETPF